MVKNLPVTQKTWVQSLGWEDPLEKETVIHSSILAWRIPWTEEPGGLQSMQLQRVGNDLVTSTGVYHTATWISHRYTYVTPSWTPSHLPSHPIPLGCPRALTLGDLLHVSNLHWSSILHMVIHMFQCCSHHPTHAFSHIVQKSVLYICVSFAALHIGSLLLSF